MNEIAEKLENINNTLEKMLTIMPKESGKFTKILETMVLFIGVFGIIALIDIIRRWIFGG